MSKSDLVPLLDRNGRHGGHAGRSDVDGIARSLAANFREAIDANSSDVISLDTLEDLLAAIVELYGTNAEQSEALVPLNLGSQANATAILMTVTAMLRGANLELFELGMWQSWSGMK